jgi:hypothetical protein
LEHTPVSTPAATFAPSRCCDCGGISTRRLLPSASTPISSCVVPLLRLQGDVRLCVSVCVGRHHSWAASPFRVRVESIYCTTSIINTTVFIFLQNQSPTLHGLPMWSWYKRKAASGACASISPASIRPVPRTISRCRGSTKLSIAQPDAKSCPFSTASPAITRYT